MYSTISIHTFIIPQSYPIPNSYLKYTTSPSYLLLNNWINQSIWILTGIPIPNPQLNGFSPSFNASIHNIYVAHYGILNVTINFNELMNTAYLNLNNSVTLISDHNNFSILMPPKTPYILILSRANTVSFITISTNSSIIYINRSVALLNTTPRIYVTSNSSYSIENKFLKIKVSKELEFIELSISNLPNFNVSGLIKLNNLEVQSWLNLSKKPKGLQNTLLREYYLSLLLIKDNQNPYLGTFAASPSPIYLYSWVRDSAFSAMALQESGHYNSALKYWLWLSNADQLQPGVWYTRYNFYNGRPDTTFGLPELDSIGLFEIGVYEYYILTGNITFLKQILPTIDKSVKFQINVVNNSNYHLLPQDLSVWEDRDAYHFWTETINDLGLLSVINIYKTLGLDNYSTIIEAEQELNQSILKYFWNDKYFASALGTSVVFENGKSEIVLSPEAPSIDSATLLPIDLGYLSPSSNYSVLNFKIVNETLNIYGGLARFSNDLYHYSQFLYDSSAPDPPWIITTLFKALYLEKIGKYNEALTLMYWAYYHSQHGLLPEAIDPKSSYPLPTTSPLTWSSAMFVKVALNYKPVNNSENIILYVIIISTIVTISALTFLTLKFLRTRKRSAFP